MTKQTDMPRRVPEVILESSVSGRNLVRGPLGEQLGSRTLLVFLRHLG